MAKKKILAGLLSFICAATLLVSCGEPTPVEDPNEFEQNTEEIPANINMYIIGSHWNSWDPGTIDKANPSCAFEIDPTSSGLGVKYTFSIEVTQDMVNAWCGFKFIASPAWTSQFGMEDVDFSKCNEDFLKLVVGDKNGDGKFDVQDKYAAFKEGTSNRNNIVATAAGKYEIEYYPYNFSSETVEGVLYQNKFAIEFTPAA